MNVYQSFYDLLNTYVFGGSIVAGSYEDLVTIFFSMTCTLFLVSLPFLIVWFLIKLITGAIK